MTTIADYLDRQVDILAFQGIFPDAREQLLVQELVRPTGGGAVVAGIEKLAQRFLVTLLTKTGSKAYRPADGTDFIRDAEFGIWRTVADVEQSFYSALVDLRRQLQAEELATDPGDERLGTAELTGVTLAGTAVSLRIHLTSVAGTGYTFLTPIAVSV